jgi:hypothetical protein
VEGNSSGYGYGGGGGGERIAAMAMGGGGRRARELTGYGGSEVIHGSRSNNLLTMVRTMTSAWSRLRVNIDGTAPSMTYTWKGLKRDTKGRK